MANVDRLSLDTGFMRDRLAAWLLPTIFLVSNIGLVSYYLVPTTQRLWLDAHIYFRATQAWVLGADPWIVRYDAIPYAAPPPALLLNLPLLPLGEDLAVAVWVVADLAAVMFLLRRFHLAPYWVLFHPIAEGLLGATPDLALAALVFVSAGAIAGVTKPYSLPALLAERRWAALGLAALFGLATLPILPWDKFVASQSVIGAAFNDYALTVSALGNPFLIVAAAVALISLGRDRGLALTTPALLALQPHYLVFSFGLIATSRLLAGILTLPLEHAAAVGVIAYAMARRYRRRMADEPAGPRPTAIREWPTPPAVAGASDP